MTAYVISEIEPRDAALFARYRALAPATIERYGGATSRAAAKPTWSRAARRPGPS